MSSQKNKGDGYERELAKFLNEWVFSGKEQCSRAPLSGGGRSFGNGGNADLIGTPAVWVEAKRTERFSPYPAMEQAENGIEGRKCPDMPVVINRKNRMPTSQSLTVMRLGDWIHFYKAYLEKLGHNIDAIEEKEEDDGLFVEFIMEPDKEDEITESVVALSNEEEKPKLKLVVNNAEEEM